MSFNEMRDKRKNRDAINSILKAVFVSARRAVKLSEVKTNRKVPTSRNLVARLGSPYETTPPTTTSRRAMFAVNPKRGI